MSTDSPSIKPLPSRQWETALGGGSGTAIIFDGDFVHKTARSNGLQKLLAEGTWLLWVTSQTSRPDLHAHFPQVCELPTARRPTLTLRRVSGSCAREAILTGPTAETQVLISRAATVAFDAVPALATARPSWDTGSWCADHFANSIAGAQIIHPWLDAVSSARRVILSDDAAFPNPLLHNGKVVIELLRTLRPPRSKALHGDFHLGNVIVDANKSTFHLLDPRGGWGNKWTFDPAYDVGKLLHEPHYVVARASVARVQLDAHSSSIVLSPKAARDASSLIELRRLADLNATLAATACRHMSADDPLVAARATLLTGVQLISILRLPHTVGYCAETLLAHGITWLEAGIRAVSCGYGLGRCQRLWTNLLGQTYPAAWAGTTIGYSLELD
jgi:hypothetical protein